MTHLYEYFVYSSLRPGCGATLNAEQPKGITAVRLLSFEREGNLQILQKSGEYLDGKKFTVKSEDLGGEIQDSYRMLRPMFNQNHNYHIVGAEKHTSSTRNLLSDRLKMIPPLWETDGKVTYIQTCFRLTKGNE
jgi:hypothetical protein